MLRDFSYLAYRRPFRAPPRTARGVWKVREGFVVAVETDEGTGYGEVAPIPWFGTETLAEAERFLRRWAAAPEAVEEEVDAAGGDRPALAFGVSAALRAAGGCRPARRDYAVAGLVPAGAEGLEVAEARVRAGFRTLKWKIGVDPVAREQELFRELAGRLPAEVRLRLDANGGLSAGALESWLEFLEPFAGRMDFFEQPLPPGDEAAMKMIGSGCRVRLALDESLVGARGFAWLEVGAWPGIFVIKPLLGGGWKALAERLAPVAGRVIFSSALETGIGMENALGLADELGGGSGQAIGFDSSPNFPDDWGIPLFTPAHVRKRDRQAFSPTSLWKQIRHSS